jgi:hypothetical protein
MADNPFLVPGPAWTAAWEDADCRRGALTSGRRLFGYDNSTGKGYVTSYRLSRLHGSRRLWYEPDKGRTRPPVVPDPTTLKVLPWAPATGWILCDLHFADGRPVPFATRGLYRRFSNNSVSAAIGSRQASKSNAISSENPRLAPANAGYPGKAPVVSLLSQELSTSYCATLRSDGAGARCGPLRSRRASASPKPMRIRREADLPNRIGESAANPYLHMSSQIIGQPRRHR